MLIAVTIIGQRAVATTPTPIPLADITIWWCKSPLDDFACICMLNNDNLSMRKICPIEGRGCWDDSGWVMPSAHPFGGGLPTYFDPDGNLYIVVGPNQGGTFSGSAIGTCLGFASNGTGTIMLPAHLVQ
jgi:hypothetical protein